MWTRRLIFMSLVSLVLSLKEKKICGLSNMESIYLQNGENGIITLNNHDPYRYTIPRCSVDLVTCPLCSIQLSFETKNLQCRKSNEEICSCGKITLREENYEKIIDMCDLTDDTFYNGFTQSILILHDFFTLNSSSSISIIYTTSKNQNFINGSIGKTGSISSMKFPSLYPRSHGSEHILSCDDSNCIITLLFTDFLISPSSIIEVFDWDGTLLQFVSGTKTRPPYVSSTGPSLIIRFLANGGSYFGYKANYYFIENTNQYNVNTECGGEIRNLGGYIYMDALNGYYDCFWIIKPVISMAYMKTHLYMNILNFTGTGEVRIHNGMTSESTLVAILTNDSFTEREYVTTISKSFYISYKGFPTKLLISYATFSYIGCLSGLDYLCNNNRCILLTLVCDSVNHCGDDSDEMKDCTAGSFIIPRYWWPLRNSDVTNDQDGKRFSAFWMCCIIVIIAVILLISTTCNRTIRIRPLTTNQLDVQTTNDQIRTITQLLSEEEETVEDDNPPNYEPPPDYNQVINLSHDIDDLQTKKCGPHSSYVKSSSSYLLESEDIDLTVDNHNSAFKRRMSDISLPISLDTAGYDDDLGLSLTTSVVSNKECENKRFSWMTKRTRSNLADSMNSANFSAASFDTLHSSQERGVNTFAAVVKSQSQDNLTSTSHNLSAKLNYNYNHLF